MYTRTNTNVKKNYVGTNVEGTAFHMVSPFKSTKQASRLSIFQDGNKISLNGKQIRAIQIGRAHV